MNKVAKLLLLATLASIFLLAASWFFFDEFLTAQVDLWQKSLVDSRLFYSLIVVAVLSADLLLPIPSSAVLTHAGITLGTISATVVGTVGLTVGSCIGFAMTRFLGRQFADRQTRRSDLVATEQALNTNGAWIIVLLRPVPILAEASILVLGLGQMKWQNFLFWLTLSNIATSFFFSAFGQWAAEQGLPEPITILVSIAIPLALLAISRFGFSAPAANSEEPVDDPSAENF